VSMALGGAGDELVIEGIAFRCVIGATEPERHIAQDVVVTVRLQADLTKAARSDALADTIDYRAVARAVVAAGQASRFHLIEALASHLGHVVLHDFPRAEAARVEVEKPGALSAARTVRAAVTVRRLS